MRCWLLREQSVTGFSRPKAGTDFADRAGAFSGRDEGLGTACHFAAGGRKQPGTGASVREQVQQCAPDCQKSHGDGDANREIAIFADGREGLRVRILYAGRTQPADNACTDDGTASGGK